MSITPMNLLRLENDRLKSKVEGLEGLLTVAGERERLTDKKIREMEDELCVIKEDNRALKDANHRERMKHAGGGMWVVLDGEQDMASRHSHVDREVPDGEINGANRFFRLNCERISGSEHVFLNGLLQSPEVDYKIHRMVLIYQTAPVRGDRIVVSYRCQS